MGEIRKYLEDSGQWDTTVVLLFSDNGGVNDLGSLNLPFRGEKGEYWEGGIRVPALIAGGYTVNSLATENGGLGSSYKYKHMVHITDMHSTALALAGIEGRDSGSKQFLGKNTSDTGQDRIPAFALAVIESRNLGRKDTVHFFLILQTPR